MKYSLFFTCLVCVLLDGTEVTSLSIFNKRTSFSLLGSRTTTTTERPTTTTKIPLQQATNGLLSSLTNLLGLGATTTTTTPTPTTAQPISLVISDVRSIQNNLNELRESESSDAENLALSTTEILSDVPKVTTTSPTTSDISTDVLPVQTTENFSKQISLESPQAGSVNQPISNVEVEQIQKLNDLLNDEKQNAEPQQTATEDVIDQGLQGVNLEQTIMDKSVPNSDTETIPIIPNVSDSVSNIIKSILNLNLTSSSPPEVESRNPTEADPLQIIKDNEEELELHSPKIIQIDDDIPKKVEQSLHPLILEDVSPLPDSSIIVDTESRSSIVEPTDPFSPEVKSVIPSVISGDPNNLLSEGLDSESTNPFQATLKHTAFDPLIVTGTNVESVPENVIASNSENNSLPYQEDPFTIQSKSEESFIDPDNTNPTEYLPNVSNILQPTASETQSTDSFASDIVPQETLSKVPSVPLNALPLEPITQQDVKPAEDMASLDVISRVVSDVPAALPVDITNSDVETISPETSAVSALPEVTLPVSSPVPSVMNYVVSTEPSNENSPKVSVSIHVPETSSVGESSSILSALLTALPSIPGLGDLVTYVLSVLNVLLATISDRIGISLENLIAGIPILHTLLESLSNIPGISPEIRSSAVASAEESFQFLSRFELNGIGGLSELLNFAYSFLNGLLLSVPYLLGGIPLATVLGLLPNFIGTFENILPNLSVGTSGTLHQVAHVPVIAGGSLADRVTENSDGEFDNLFNYMDAPLVDIHHNEINLLKIVIA